MSNHVSRRGFMKTAGAAAGVTLALGRAPFSYAANERIRVASIGTGGQGSFHLRDGLSRAHNIDIVAVCDVYRPHLEGGWKNAGGGNVKKYMDYREMLDKEEFEAVCITTPLDSHYQLTKDCLEAGKHCFTEKTLCQTVEQCREVCTIAHDKNLILQVGHQRRYNPTYNHAIKLAWEEGVLGRINHVDCQWHRNNDWRRPVSRAPLSAEERKFIPDLERHINWRLYKEKSGGLMCELATHQLDIANWFLDAMPYRVFGYGGTDYWRDGREVRDTVNLVYEYHISPENRGFRAIKPRSKEQYLHSRKTDALNAKGLISEPYKVYFVYSSICGNAMRGCTELIQGDQGTFEMTETGSLFFREVGAKVAWADSAQRDEDDQNALVITSGGTLGLSNKKRKDAKPFAVDTDKSPDQRQFEGFADCAMHGGQPQSNYMVGLRSAICGHSGLEALEKGHEVIIDPAWYTFDFETPDPSMHYEA